MLIQLLRAKLHQARVTAADVNYVGSIRIHDGLLDQLRRSAVRTSPGGRARKLQPTREKHRDLFAGLSTPTLCHEDLNPNNLVFNIRDGQPELIGILDFESAWASTGESDLARLEFWWMTAGTAIRQGYSEVADVAAEYMMRKPLLRLLWCLEYAEHHASVEHQALTSGVCAELGLPEIQLG